MIKVANLSELFRPSDLLLSVMQKQQVADGVAYIPSQFNLLIEHGGHKYTYNTLTSRIIEGDVPPRANAGEGFDELIKDYFLVAETKDECSYYEELSRMVRTLKFVDGYKSYVILPTLACNAKCVYCYEEGMKQVSMTPSVADKTIEFIKNTFRGNAVQISWFGGEPLLGEYIIDYICDNLAAEGIPYRSGMITNGSMITPSIIDKMTKKWNLNRIQLSMDGARDDYIARKRYNSYNKYYETVLASANSLSSKGIHVTIRCNLDFDNIDGLPSFVDDLRSSIAEKNRKNVSIDFAPLFSVRDSDDDINMWRFIATEGARLLKQTGFAPPPLRGNTIGFRSNHCMADNHGVVIGPDGSLYPCEHCPEEARFGNIFDGVTDPESYRRFTDCNSTRERCRKCTFLPICTSFPSCPAVDRHCKESQELSVSEAIKRRLAVYT